MKLTAAHFALSAAVLAAGLAGCSGHLAGNIRADVAERLSPRERKAVNEAARVHGPSSPQFHYTVGEVLFLKGAGVDALGEAASALSKRENQDDVSRAALLESVRYLEEALRESPELFEIHYELGVAYFLLGEDEPAIRRIEEYTSRLNRSSVTTFYPASYKVLGYAYKKERRPDAARRAFKEYISLVPYAPDISEVLREVEATKRIR